MAPALKVELRALTADEQGALERISQARSERLDHVQRARALLAVAAGASRTAAAAQAGFRSPTTVSDLIARFNRAGLAALTIAAGRGRKPTYDAAARARVVATAQRRPDRNVDGTAEWSLKTLERTIRREGLPRVGATTVRRVLGAAGSSFQRTRTWCPTGTAQRVRTAGVVTVTDPDTEVKRG
jgi:transposase